MRHVAHNTLLGAPLVLLRLAAVAAVLTLVCGFAVPAAAAVDTAPPVAPAPLTLTADSIVFYNDRFLVEADGHVALTMGSLRISGEAFSMDLKLNRFVVAGDVDVESQTNHYTGAGFADFIDYRRAYFVPSGDPDRWTFVDGDYATPLKGREMPGDAFALPDVSRDRVTLSAKRAVIKPTANVTFLGANVRVGPAMVPAESYYVNFSRNPNFAQNAQQGATGAVGYPFAGSSNAQSALYLRYDSTNKTYLGFEQHLLSSRSYLVFAASPFTRPQKQFNVLGSQTIGSRLQVRAFGQLNTFQLGLSQPLSASAYQNVQIVYALPHSYLQLEGSQWNQSLLAQPTTIDPNTGYPYYGDGSHYWVPNHPNTASLSWIGAPVRIARYVPINFRTSAGISTSHDIYGNWNFLGGPYVTLWQHYAGLSTYTNPINVGGPARTLFALTGSYERTRTWYSEPHVTESTRTTIGASKQLRPRVNGYLAYQVQNVYDDCGARQLSCYAPNTSVVSPYTGVAYPGFGAFVGRATSRSLVGSATWQPSAAFAFSMTARRSYDFPAPIPYIYGQAPYFITGNLQARLLPHLSVQLSRDYSFNWGNLGYSPRFGIQFGP